MVCLDVANGYSEHFVLYVRKVPVFAELPTRGKCFLPDHLKNSAADQKNSAAHTVLKR
jgi:hypothetical protein